MEWSDLADRLPKSADEESAALRAPQSVAAEAGPPEERERRLAWLQGASLGALRAAVGKLEAAEAAAESEADAADDYRAGGGGGAE
jgi:hypothetical protein